MKKYVLAYSGGLDTSVMLKWLQLEHHVQVVTVTANLGQQKELDGVGTKALVCGAKNAYVEDLRRDFVERFVWPTFKAGALYQGVYPMATAIGRPLIAEKLVEIARSENADAIVHGCTGKGNDQVRFEVAIGALAPELECIAPLRTWDLKTREQEIAWASEHGIPVAASRKSPYSIDENLWGVSVECGVLEDPWAEPPSDCWQITTDPCLAPDKSETLTIDFEEGIPRAIDGQNMSGVELIESLNLIAGSHGVGRIDMVEDRVVGIKSREVYEAPAATVLAEARNALEQLTLDRETRRVKLLMGQELARLAYDGFWFSPLRESISSFVDQASNVVTGQVRVSLYRGTCTVLGRQAPRSLYQGALATYGEGDAFSHDSARGFIDIFGQSTRISSSVARSANPDPSAIPGKPGALV